MERFIDFYLFNQNVKRMINEQTKAQPEILTEATDSAGKAIITHLSHLEDFLIEKGLDGVPLFINAVHEAMNLDLKRQGDVKLSVKIDGAPAMYMGIDPDDGKFFVATKSINNKVPKLTKSLDQIKDQYESKGLQEKMTWAFKTLSKINIDKNFIYQGDIIFTNSDKKMEKIDGVSHLTFTPNTITYAVPVDNQSITYNKIKNAQFGVAFHTRYKFSKEEDKFNMSQASPYFDDLVNQSKSIADLFIEDVLVKGTALDIKFKNEAKIKANLAKISKLTKKVKKDVFKQMSDIKNFLPRLRVFVNSQLRTSTGGIFKDAMDGKPFNNSKFFKEMKAVFTTWWDKQIGKLKSEKGKAAKTSVRDSWIAFIDENLQDLVEFFQVYYLMIETKNLVYSDMKSIVDKLGKSYIRNQDGSFTPVGGEGIVLIGKKNTIKLVDRLEFSRINFLASDFQK
jgi:hypothetical protein